VKLDFGAAIRGAREARQMTQRQVAQLASLQQSHLSLLESGRRYPSLSALDRIAAALRLPSFVLVYLATPEETLAPFPPQVRRELDRVVEGFLCTKDQT